jgi:hypothetical protein
MNIEKAMIIDIDNTLIDSRCQAQYYPTAENPTREDWDEFQKHTKEYEKNTFIEDFIFDKILLYGCYPIFVTSREDINGVREATEAVIKEAIGDVDYLLFMRKPYDYSSDRECKDGLFAEVEMCCPADRIEFAIDDKTEICELWQSKGIPTLQFRFGG